MSEQLKNYYIFEYVFDSNEDCYTSIEGEVQAYVKATDPFDACERTGFTDSEKYFARPMESAKKHKELIKKERNHLSKLSKQLAPMLEEEKELQKKCPNCGADLDENFNCDECGFGHEYDEEDEE